MDFIEAPQDLLIEKYAGHGLTIEANPSSNVYIGHIGDYWQPPVFRWNPPNLEWLTVGEWCNQVFDAECHQN
jgi:hypothetical protein